LFSAPFETFALWQAGDTRGLAAKTKQRSVPVEHSYLFIRARGAPARQHNPGYAIDGKPNPAAVRLIQIECGEAPDVSVTRL
jgi:hypothetical protein